MFGVQYLPGYAELRAEYAGLPAVPGDGSGAGSRMPGVPLIAVNRR